MVASSSGSIATSGSAEGQVERRSHLVPGFEPGGQVAPVAADDATQARQVGELVAEPLQALPVQHGDRGPGVGQARTRARDPSTTRSAARRRRRARWSPRTRSSTPGSSSRRWPPGRPWPRRSGRGGGRPTPRRAAGARRTWSARPRRRGTPCRRRHRSSPARLARTMAACRNTRQGTPSMTRSASSNGAPGSRQCLHGGLARLGHPRVLPCPDAPVRPQPCGHDPT